MCMAGFYDSHAFLGIPRYRPEIDREGKRLSAIPAGLAGGVKDEFVCIMSAVSKSGPMYQSLKETGACVLNFPSYGHI